MGHGQSSQTVLVQVIKRKTAKQSLTGPGVKVCAAECPDPAVNLPERGRRHRNIPVFLDMA